MADESNSPVIEENLIVENEVVETSNKTDSVVELHIPIENSTDFPLALLNQFKRIKYDEKEFLRYSQYIVREYIINSHGRGLLCYWGMGFGKTPLAVSITEYYRINDPGRNIIFLSAKSLANNFKNSLANYMKDVEHVGLTEVDRIIENHYSFVSSNASNMFKQIQSINKSEEEILYEKKLGDLTSAYKKDHALENSLVIVDEAHNLFNSISNGSKNALGFYDLVMRTKNIKLIFLTGTPAVNDPFELVACFNMLKGRISETVKRRKYEVDRNYKKKPEPEPEPIEAEVPDTDSGNVSDDEAEGGYLRQGGYDENDDLRQGGYDENDDLRQGGSDLYTLFPENREDFENWFVDYTSLGIKNQPIFQSRLSGLVSYYGPIYFDKGDGTPREFFPKELPAIIKKIPMSTEQFASYAMARDKERTEANRPKFKRESDRFSSGQKASSTYRVESRQLSNFRFPIHALKAREGLKMPEKLLDKLTEADLNDSGLSSNSPKMLEIYKDIMNFFNSGKRLGIFYSSFIVSGLKVFAKVLEERGWKSYNSTDIINQKASEDIENKLNESMIENTGLNEEIKEGGLIYFDGKNLEQISHKSKRYQEIPETKSGGGGAYRRPLDIDDFLVNPIPKPLPPSKQKKNRIIRKGGDGEVKQTYKYAIISGEIDPEERAEIVKIFNSPANAHGSVIDLLLISSTGVEGLDLKGLRFGIMLEPYWHDARRGQFAARMIRYKSHEHLPLDERDCQLMIYLSDYPTKLAASTKAEEKTTDIDLYDSSIAGKIILDKFFLAVIESSIDCNIHHSTLDPTIQKKINCLLCKPTGIPLYNANISHDFEQERPCQALGPISEQKSITAKEIDVDGKKFYYTYDAEKGIDSLKIYEYNKELNGHVPIRASNPYYPSIMEKLLAFLI